MDLFSCSIPFRNFISARVNNTNLHVVVEDFPHKNLLLTNDQSDSEIQTSTRPNPGTGTGTNTLSDVCLPFTNADQCWHAYRALTERIVFYSRQRADDIENPHFKCRWHSFVAKVNSQYSTLVLVPNVVYSKQQQHKCVVRGLKLKLSIFWGEN